MTDQGFGFGRDRDEDRNREDRDKERGGSSQQGGSQNWGSQSTQGSCSVNARQREQRRISAFSSAIAAASSRAYSASARSRKNASRVALFSPMPGNRERRSTSRFKGAGSVATVNRRDRGSSVRL